MKPLHKTNIIMEKILKNCPCSLQAWIGAGEPVLEEGGLYFSRKDEVREYLNRKLQKFKGEMVECYVSQTFNGKWREILVCFRVE